VHKSPPFYYFIFTLFLIIAKTDKVCVKFSFLTENLTLLRYDSDRKTERVMKNEPCEKDDGTGYPVGCRNCHAMLRRLAWRGGDGAKQGH
jgi:hypothetical protein